MTTIVGVDCATDPRKVGLALARVDGSKVRLLAAECGFDSPSMAGRIAEWMGEEPAVLLALDAPLGWPIDLGATLAGHSAGAPTRPRKRLRIGTRGRATQSKIFNFVACPC